MSLTDPTEDLALLTEMRGGNATAFEALFRRHQAPLYRFALLRSGSPDTAADIVQEIFMNLLSNVLKFDPARGALQGFLFGVARNLALKRDAAQSRYVTRKHHENEDAGDIEDTIIDPAPQPAQRLLDHEQAEMVRRALQQLAPHYRDVVILYEMHDLTYVEIAQICNIDIGTVRSRLSRARAKLFELLQPDFPETVASNARQTQSPQQEARS
ncbi:MAG: RNA polymerase sigma factor [Betaproteobacteria bacterium]|nr:RNA polymerase sigma factor [Betaproteobacteria bacterium]